MAIAPTPELLVITADRSLPRDIHAVIGKHFKVVPLREPSRATELLRPRHMVRAVIVHLNDSESTRQLLHTMQRDHASVRRIAIAAPEEFTGIIEGLHSGAIEHLLHLPLKPRDLITSLGRKETVARGK